jgi:hypothetical protein
MKFWEGFIDDWHGHDYVTAVPLRCLVSETWTRSNPKSRASRAPIVNLKERSNSEVRQAKGVMTDPRSLFQNQLQASSVRLPVATFFICSCSAVNQIHFSRRIINSSLSRRPPRHLKSLFFQAGHAHMDRCPIDIWSIIFTLACTDGGRSLSLTYITSHP